MTTQPLGDSVLPGPQKVSVFVGPVYGCSKSDGIPYCPSLHEVLSEWIDAVNSKTGGLEFRFSFRHLVDLLPLLLFLCQLEDFRLLGRVCLLSGHDLQHHVVSPLLLTQLV